MDLDLINFRHSFCPHFVHRFSYKIAQVDGALLPRLGRYPMDSGSHPTTRKTIPTLSPETAQ